MNYTTNYNLNKPEGTDLYNHLTIDNPNMDTIDAAMYSNKLQAIGNATELVSGTVHALTRSDNNQNIFKFKATGDFKAGDSITVDGVSVTAYTTGGQQLKNDAYVLSAEVVCILDGTSLWVLVNKDQDAADVTYDNTSSGLIATDVQDAIDEVSATATSKSKCVTQFEVFDLTGISGDWVYKNVTFTTPYASTPIVSVEQFQTATATNWPMPMIDNITATGFRIGWYSASGTKKLIWQAFGIIN